MRYKQHLRVFICNAATAVKARNFKSIRDSDVKPPPVGYQVKQACSFAHTRCMGICARELVDGRLVLGSCGAGIASEMLVAPATLALRSRTVWMYPLCTGLRPRTPVCKVVPQRSYFEHLQAAA